MQCCVCGKNLDGQPALVDRATGEAFCYGDRDYFGLDPRQRPKTPKPDALKASTENHAPGGDPVQELLNILDSWVDSSQAVANQTKLAEFMDSFATNWHVSWKKGTRGELVDWLRSCANRDYGSGGQHDIEVIGLAPTPGKYGEMRTEDAPAFWDAYGVVGSVIEPCVAGRYHIIGKASDAEFFFLAHK